MSLFKTEEVTMKRGKNNTFIRMMSIEATIRGVVIADGYQRSNKKMY